MSRTYTKEQIEQTPGEILYRGFSSGLSKEMLHKTDIMLLSGMTPEWILSHLIADVPDDVYEIVNRGLAWRKEFLLKQAKTRGRIARNN